MSVETPSADALSQRMHSRMVTLVDRKLVTHFLEVAPNGSTLHPPLIVLIHGFPELAYSWRHVMIPLADMGYRVVAPDLRSYGRTTAMNSSSSSDLAELVGYADDLAPYTITSLAADIRSLILVLGEQKAECILGHDFGSLVAGAFAQLYPSMLDSVVCMSAPYTGIPSHLIKPNETPREASIYRSIFQALAELDPPRKHYTTYFSSAEANSDLLNAKSGLEKFFREYFYVKSANWPKNQYTALQVRMEDGPQAIANALGTLPDYYIMRMDETMPQTVSRLTDDKTAVVAGLDDQDVQNFASEYARTGFQGGLNNYRANAHPHTGKFASTLITVDDKQDLTKLKVPAMYIAGKHDVGAWQTPGAIDQMKLMMTGRPGKAPIGELSFIDDAGHWVQQENPTKVLEVVEKFLKAVNEL